MNLHEYQAKALLANYGVPVLSGIVVRTPKEALEAFKQLGGQSAVIKAQIHAGARGKAGGVRIVYSGDDAFDEAKNLLGQFLVTEQTGPEGQLVGSVLVCENVYPVAKELYLAATIDRAMQCITFMVADEGGVDIEAVAATHPERIFKISLDPLVGMQPHKARALAFELGLTGVQINEWVTVLQGIYRAFVDNDATLLEINPLSIGLDGRLMCIDAKMTIDENALYRVPKLAEIFDTTQLNYRERKATELDLNYVTLEGNIGCMVNGAGLAMATMDIIKLYGGSPANFLDIGGDATKERVIDAFQLILADSSVSGILINIFGGIVHCDMVASAIIEAVHTVEVKVPVVVRLAGNSAKLGAQLLQDSGLSLITAEGLADAAQKIVEATATSEKASIQGKTV